MLLEPGLLGNRAQILNQTTPVREVFELEAGELDRANIEETEAIAAMEKKRADEIERGRREIMSDPIKEIFQESDTLPVCTRTHRLLITGKGYILWY
jgi:hypothetical protein